MRFDEIAAASWQNFQHKHSFGTECSKNQRLHKACINLNFKNAMNQ